MFLVQGEQEEEKRNVPGTLPCWDDNVECFASVLRSGSLRVIVDYVMYVEAGFRPVPPEAVRLVEVEARVEEVDAAKLLRARIRYVNMEGGEDETRFLCVEVRGRVYCFPEPLSAED